MNKKRLKKMKSEIKSRDLPGMRLILLALYFNCFIICLPVINYLGIPVPIRYISLGGFVIIFTIVMIGAYKYMKWEHPQRLITKYHHKKIQLWFFMIFALTIYGLMRNPLDDVINELFAFIYIGLFLLIGADDRFWYLLMRHLTIIFYIGAGLIVFFYQVPAIILTYSNQFVSEYGLNYRFSNTIGYGLRQLINFGVILGVWGALQRGFNLLRLCQIGSLVLFFIINVFLFKFRSSAIFCLMGVGSFLLFRPILEKRLRPGIGMMLILVTIIGLSYYVTSESWAQMLNYRISDRIRGWQIVNSRQREAEAYLSDMGLEIIWGRGLGGSFNAVQVFGYGKGEKRYSTHYGLMAYTLKGGLPFLFLFISFLSAGIRLRTQKWYANPINLTASILFPIYLLSMILNPMPFSSGSLISYVPVMALFSRFGRRVELDIK